MKSFLWNVVKSTENPTRESVNQPALCCSFSHASKTGAGRLNGGLVTQNLRKAYLQPGQWSNKSFSFVTSPLSF